MGWSAHDKVSSRFITPWWQG